MIQYFCKRLVKLPDQINHWWRLLLINEQKIPGHINTSLGLDRLFYFPLCVIEFPLQFTHLDFPGNAPTRGAYLPTAFFPY
jgi:hypothetical protein